MKCLIFSDSHGSHLALAKALKLHPDCDIVFFLGDGLSDFDMLALGDNTKMWIAVRGNCDYDPYFKDKFVPKTDTITLFGKKIVLTHDDLYGVKSGEGGLISLAREEQADIVLFGHTHRRREFYHEGVYYFNPGSLTPSYPNPSSYGLLTIDENNILLSHGYID